MADQSTTEATASVTSYREVLEGGDQSKIARMYMDMVELAGKQEEDWRKDAANAVEIYRADKKRQTPFNILFPNTQTICPALYNSKPDPDVRVRDHKKSEEARRGAQIIEMGIRYQTDEHDFDAIADAAVLDMVLPGRGVARVRWKTYIRKDPETGEDKVVWEETCPQHVKWKHFRRGPGHIWDEVKWVAYELFLDTDELRKLMRPKDKQSFDPITQQPITVPPTDEQLAALDELVKKIPLDVEDEDEDKNSKKDNQEKTVLKRARVWEIWDKNIRKVIFIAPGFLERPLTTEDDPLNLLDFFDCAPPLMSISDPESLVPICPYEIYREQAEELAVISDRIIKLTRILKLRGIRASEISEFDRMEELDDGQYVASEGALALVGGAKGLSDSIWTWPIKEIAEVIQQLVFQREQCKQTIYELTGLSDILRGASNPHETLGAQQIKAQWGSMRVNKDQRKVQRWCAQIFNIMAEIIANKFSDSTLAFIIGEQVPPEVISLLRNDIRRTYLIDIETDSTIRGDMQRNQEQMSNFMMATGQFIQTFVPLLKEAQMPPQMAQTAVIIYGAFARNFKLGKTVDDALAALEIAASQMQIGQKDPQQAAMEKEQHDLAVANATQTIRKTAAEADKAEAEAQATKASFGQNAAEAQANLTKSQTSAQAERAKLAGLAMDQKNKDIKTEVDAHTKMAKVAKTEAETQRTHVETAILASGKTPGFSEPKPKPTNRQSK